ncbi:MAG: efflux RND transporter periplasmic adaptor subunit [Vicingus serpentipes]|nr:efflux RND transporter periplasmic adaptor subunit [Vicingus serpentipes]
MKNRVYLISILFLISCGGDENLSTQPIEQNLTESVYSSVTIQPDSMYEVYSAVTGILDRVLVEEGDLVKFDQPLLQIINTNPKLNTENARLAMQIAKANYNGKNPILDDLKNEIKVAELKFQNDSINFVRQQNLWSKNIGSQVDFDTRKLQYELSKQNVKTLKNKYLRTSTELKQQLEQATNNYQASFIQTKDFTLKSKINGRIYSIYKNQGELISVQQPVAMVGSQSKFIAELMVDEVDIAKIELGQKVLITLDAYGVEVFEATIGKIYPQKNERSQTFKIEAEFVREPAKLFPGLSGEANIIVAEKSNVLSIPKIYLINGNKVKTDNGIIEIKTGLESLDKIEVLSGIDKNTVIYLPEE